MNNLSLPYFYLPTIIYNSSLVSIPMKEFGVKITFSKTKRSPLLTLGSFLLLKYFQIFSFQDKKYAFSLLSSRS